MPVVEQASKDTLLTMFKSELIPAIGDIRYRGLHTAQRIAEEINPRRVPSYLRYFYHDSSRGLYVSRKPESLFGGNSTLYSVTSTLALEKSDEKSPLLVPAYSHLREFDNVQTHRGIGLELTTTLMRQFGSNMGDKDPFVWLGPHIDPEQFFLDNKIAQKGSLVDQEMATLFFGHPEIDFIDDIKGDLQWARQALHPVLKRVVEGIIDGRNLYEEDPESREYVDHFMATIHENFGLRDGWYTFLGNILKGKKPPPRIPDKEGFADDLVTAAMESQPVPKASRAVVLAFNAQKLFDSMPIYPFPLTARPPDELVPAALVNEDALEGAFYFGEKPDVLGRFNKMLYPVSNLPKEIWLRDKNDQYVTPSDVAMLGIDPDIPICIFRYNKTPEQVADQYCSEIIRGNIAPWNPQDEYLDIVNPGENMRALVYRNLLLRSIQSTGIVDRVTEITGDREKAIERILELKVDMHPSPIQRILLPSVSSLIGSSDPERDWR